MADKITLQGVKDIKGNKGGASPFALINPRRGGDTHQIAQWWDKSKTVVYKDCTIIKVTRTGGDLLLAIPSTMSTMLTIVYDGADSFSFFNTLHVDRIGVLNAADWTVIEEYVLPHIVGGKTMKRTIGVMPSAPVTPPAPVVPNIGTVTVTGSTATAIPGGSTTADESYDVVVIGGTSVASNQTPNWTVTKATASTAGLEPTLDAVDADPVLITFKEAGTYSVQCTINDATASPTSQASNTLSVVVS